MIVVHGETLWSPAPQPMDDDDDGTFVVELGQDRGQNGIVPPSKPALIEL